MKIRDILGKKQPTLSFEVFPPKNDNDYAKVEEARSIYKNISKIIG